MTFSDQAERYMSEIATRKRNPARANTLSSYRSILNNHILPVLGELSLKDVGNGAAKLLAGRLAEARLSPASINLAVTLVKQVVKSAVDGEGNQLYPRTWNDGFIGVPEVTPASQKAPIAPSQAIQEAISATLGGTQALIGLLAGSGLRIGEALALTTLDDGISNLWDPARGTVLVRATFVHGKLQPTPKTESGNREVNLDPALNAFLLKHFTQDTGVLFPLSKQTYERRFRSAGLNYGFHGLRRFRETHLESVGVARMLMKYWTGHAGSDITERYIKFGPKVEERKQKAVEAGLGFSL